MSDQGGSVIAGRFFWSDDRVAAVLAQLKQRYVQAFGPSGNVMGQAPIHHASGITAIGDVITSMPGLETAEDIIYFTQADHLIGHYASLWYR